MTDTRSTPARCPYCDEPCSLCQCPADAASALMSEATRYWIDDCPVVDPVAFRTMAERAYAWGKQQSAQSESAPIGFDEGYRSGYLDGRRGKTPKVELFEPATPPGPKPVPRSAGDEEVG